MSAVLGDARDDAPEAAARANSSDTDWGGLASATDSAQLCRHWLAVQCGRVDGTIAALLLLKSAAGDSYVPAAVWPDPQRDLAYLAAPAQQALGGRAGVVQTAPAMADGVASVYVAYPVEIDGELFGVVALDLTPRSDAALRDVLRELLWGAAWLET